jgi:hypothetical protein
MSAYYSTQNNANGGLPGNFGISNAIRVGVQGNVPNYNYGINNAGLLPPSAGVNTQTNVIMPLLSGTNATNGLGMSTALAQSVEQSLGLNKSVIKYNGNVLTPPGHPKYTAYANETSFNVAQD